MARFKPIVDIWSLSNEERAALQPGQWVFAGSRDNVGRFYGEGRSTVVAWRGNWKGRYRDYNRALSDYGATVRKRA